MTSLHPTTHRWSRATLSPRTWMKDGCPTGMTKVPMNIGSRLTCHKYGGHFLTVLSWHTTWSKGLASLRPMPHDCKTWCKRQTWRLYSPEPYDNPLTRPSFSVTQLCIHIKAETLSFSHTPCIYILKPTYERPIVSWQSTWIELHELEPPH